MVGCGDIAKKDIQGYCFNDSFTMLMAKLEIEKVLKTKIEVQKDIKFHSVDLQSYVKKCYINRIIKCI